MFLYLLPCIISFCAAIQYDLGGHKDAGKKTIWLGLYLYLILFIGLRYMVGGDSYFYMLYFKDSQPHNLFDLSWDNEYQPLFTLLVSFSKTVYPDFTIFQLLHALIINTCLFYFISKNTPYRFTSLCLCFLCFYINFSVEIMRESLAIIVFMLNYKNLEQNKWLKYYLGVGIAFMFHLSAIFLIVLPLFKYLKIDRKYFLLLFLSYFILSHLSFIFSFFENIEKIDKKINDYAEATYGWKSTILFVVTRTIIPIGIGFWAKKNFQTPIKYESMLCVFGLLGIGSIFNPIIFTRFSNYIMPFYIITLANIIIPSFKRGTPLLKKIHMLAFCIMIFISYSISSFYWPESYYRKWIPYHSVFSLQHKYNLMIDRDY